MCANIRHTMHICLPAVVNLVVEVEREGLQTDCSAGKGYSLFAYSRFAYFRPKSGVLPTHKKQLYVMF